MTCDLCHADEATNHIQMIFEGSKKSLHLCPKCAAKKKISPKMFEGVALSEMLCNFADLSRDAVDDGNAGETCEGCGLTAREFQTHGLLGCPKCYESFSHLLAEALPSMHEGQRHLGKAVAKLSAAPRGEIGITGDRLTCLHDRLHEAVSAEDYEEAAQLRDEISRLETHAPAAPDA